MHLAAGDPAAALVELLAANQLWQALSHELWQARTLRDIGAAHAALGDHAAAHHAWAQAQKTFTEFGTRERTELTAWRLQWGCSCPAELLPMTEVCA